METALRPANETVSMAPDYGSPLRGAIASYLKKLESGMSPADSYAKVRIAILIRADSSVLGRVKNNTTCQAWG